MTNDEPIFSLEGPFGYAECFKFEEKRYQLFFEPYGVEGLMEYIKPISVGVYDTYAAAYDAASKITATDALDKVNVEGFF